MSKTEAKSHVISIRVSDAEKRKIDIFARSRKRKPSSLAKALILEGIEKRESNTEERLIAFQEFQKKLEGRKVISRDPQEIIDDIRKFRGDV